LRFHRVRRDRLEDPAAATGDAESLLHHIDPLIAIDLERGLGVQLLVRTTRSVKPDQERSSAGLECEASLTITSRADESEFLVFDLP
jgi:hypothetical protein